MPISRVRSSTAVYIARNTTRNPNTTASPTTVAMNALRPGILSGVDQGQKLLHRIDLIAIEEFLKIAIVPATFFASLTFT